MARKWLHSNVFNTDEQGIVHRPGRLGLPRHERLLGPSAHNRRNRRARCSRHQIWSAPGLAAQTSRFLQVRSRKSATNTSASSIKSSSFSVKGIAGLGCRRVRLDLVAARLAAASPTPDRMAKSSSRLPASRARHVPCRRRGRAEGTNCCMVYKQLHQPSGLRKIVGIGKLCACSAGVT